MAANTALTCWGMVGRLLEVSCGVWRLCSGSFVFSWLGVWSSMDQTSSNVPQMLYRKKDLGNLEAGSTIWALWNVSQSNPEKFLVMCQGTLSPWRKHCHQGGPLPEGVYLVVWVGGVCPDQRILFQKFDHMWPTFIAWSSLFFSPMDWPEDRCCFFFCLQPATWHLLPRLLYGLLSIIWSLRHCKGATTTEKLWERDNGDEMDG